MRPPNSEIRNQTNAQIETPTKKPLIAFWYEPFLLDGGGSGASQPTGDLTRLRHTVLAEPLARKVWNKTDDKREGSSDSIIDTSIPIPDVEPGRPAKAVPSVFSKVETQKRKREMNGKWNIHQVPVPVPRLRTAFESKGCLPRSPTFRLAGSPKVDSPPTEPSQSSRPTLRVPIAYEYSVETVRIPRSPSDTSTTATLARRVRPETCTKTANDSTWDCQDSRVHPPISQMIVQSLQSKQRETETKAQQPSPNYTPVPTIPTHLPTNLSPPSIKQEANRKPPERL
ncbi:hypothetical protein BP00DRAFT_493373 [Aspergillus indologenus CBS 114.80]|uniref:Uncharacterized protein n=1 Tax=Aspergillus indologenus CBS 114.80 TaxID=1450541 RepID=A0A2V5IDK9_9EURO|nr:hypothetical protein BP00DRAFT_493373 [Aspergillus indologenus CBS 114.80]